MNHTPGPWNFETCPINGHLVIGALPGEDSPEVVARVQHPDNARLIAAAPDLLAVANQITNGDIGPVELIRIIAAARAAIAKATGAM